MEEQWASWDPKKEGHLISSKNRWLWLIKMPPTDVSFVWGCGAVSLDGWSLTFWNNIVVSSARVKMFMEKHGEICMDILTPEDKTTTLSHNSGHQSLNDLLAHPRPQLHHCNSIKLPQYHAVTHLFQHIESEKVLKKAVLQGNWGCTKHHQTCEDHGNWGNFYGKQCVATWRLVDFSKDWRCYAQFTFWIQRQLIMNCRLDKVVRP